MAKVVAAVMAVEALCDLVLPDDGKEKTSGP
jgi:hypothetical protein